MCFADLKDDKIIIEVAVELNDEDDDDSYFNYDSRKATGHVGIRNQGATCYMNSLLQTLYATPYFTNAVYQVPLSFVVVVVVFSLCSVVVVTVTWVVSRG